MNPTVLAALIGAVGALIVCLINNHYQDKNRKTDEAVRDAQLDMRLSSIERKLDEHNGYAEKIGGMRVDIAYIKGKMEEQRS